ncbi:ATP-binding protein [Streptomyces sp. NPDC002092]
MTFELDLLATPKAVPELRHHLRTHDFEVHLCATELLTNVLDHLGEGTPVKVRVTSTPHGHTRIEVTDPDPRALPILLSATGTAESGRGLALVDQLSRRWGVDQGADHKTVWCELAGIGIENQSSRPPAGPLSATQAHRCITEKTQTTCG